MKASQIWRSRFFLLLSLLLALAVPALAAGAPAGIPGGTPGGKDLPPPPRVVASLYFKSDPGDYIGGGQEVTLTQADGDFRAEAFGDVVHVFFYGNDGVSSWNLYIAAGDGKTLHPGSYENTQRYPFNDSGPGLDFTGNGRGCNESSGRFDLLELTYKPDGSLDRLAVDFQQSCDGGPLLHGQVRYAPAAIPSPPDGPWITAPGLSGFRVKARITTPAGKIAGAGVADCIVDTLCLSGAVAGRPELFVRVQGPRPNGYLWTILPRFTSSEIELWVEQTTKSDVNYYYLPPGQADDPNLPGIVDRTGFRP